MTKGSGFRRPKNLRIRNTGVKEYLNTMKERKGECRKPRLKDVDSKRIPEPQTLPSSLVSEGALETPWEGNSGGGVERGSEGPRV
jgi:hypothetical protein